MMREQQRYTDYVDSSAKALPYSVSEAERRHYTRADRFRAFARNPLVKRNVEIGVLWAMGVAVLLLLPLLAGMACDDWRTGLEWGFGFVGLATLAAGIYLGIYLNNVIKDRESAKHPSRLVKRSPTGLFACGVVSFAGLMFGIVIFALGLRLCGDLGGPPAPPRVVTTTTTTVSDTTIVSH